MKCYCGNEFHGFEAGECEKCNPYDRLIKLVEEWGEQERKSYEALSAGLQSVSKQIQEVLNV